MSELPERAKVSFSTGEIELVCTTPVADEVSNQHVSDARQILDLITDLEIEMLSSGAELDQRTMIMDDVIFVKANSRIAEFWLLFIEAGEPVHDMI